MSMPWVVDRFRHHVVAGGWRHSVARAASRALDLAAGRVQSASARLLDPTATDRRLPKRIGDQLALNAAFRNRFRDARALVVASGPSARRLDAQMADGRAIIVVNEMFGQVKGAGLRLTAVVLHDQLYFSGTPEMDRFLSDITAVARADGALMIVPAAYGPRLVSEGLVEPSSMLTFFESGMPIALARQPTELIDLARAIPSLQTVSHTALASALFLGFAEIALIGVDLNFVGTPSVPVAHSYGKNRYYDLINHASAADAFRSGHGWDWPFVLRDVARQLEAYDWIARGAARHGRRIVNLAQESLLTTVASIEQRHVP